MHWLPAHLQLRDGPAGDAPALVREGEKGKRALVGLEIDLLPNGRRKVGALAGDAGGERLSQASGKLMAIERRQPGEQAVRGQHHQPGVLHADQHHEHIVRWMARGQRPGGCQFVSVVTGGLVAMVPIGNKHRLRADAGGNGTDHLHVGYGPHAVDHAQVVHRFDRRPACHGSIEHALNFARGIGIQPKHLAEISLAGPREQQAVLLGRGQRLFVRKDPPFAEPLQPAAAHESAPHTFAPLAGEMLVIDIERRHGIGGEQALVLPVAKEARRSGVSVVLLVVAGLFAVQDQPHDVGGVALVERVLEGRIDHVVRRGRDVAQRAHVPQVVADAAKGLNLWHQ